MFCPNSTAAVDQVEESNVLVTSVVSCILSIIGAVIILLTYYCMESIRNTTRKLVTVLSVADFITSAGFLSATVAQQYTSVNKPFFDTIYCELQSAVTTYSSMVSFFLTVAIAGYLFFAITRNAVVGKGFYLASNIVSWIFPGIIIGVALQYKMLGRATSDPIGTGPGAGYVVMTGTKQPKTVHCFTCYLLENFGKSVVTF
ncbi:uncharacterized protein LOC127882435 [Dreissena polymorpha]|uniref:uncharacterized protein LOC127882435 n=1 Tax=Dreissena polymorpha TaxID=45954 RepID=UPI002264920A|nr:uncharacterized protein LOC127882435 [Dreissena polymorpha]